MSTVAVCEFLEWDSKFFGRRIARVNVPCLTEELVGEIDAWCRLNRIDCLYFLANATDRQTARLAQNNMFRFVDVRVTLELRLSMVGGDRHLRFRVRDAYESDIAALRLLARTSHRDSRFYYDENFSDQACDELYETWIERSCRGWAKRVLVAEQGNDLAGYLTCHIPSPESGSIGLVGVKEEARGRGIGTGLMSSAIIWFAKQGTEKISVVTQGRNVSAQRFYQKCGFVTRSVGFWFHRWYSLTGKIE
jgi:dTDP-4-amino-4,6-dideoxy-D-galactose acyltransferase